MPTTYLDPLHCNLAKPIIAREIASLTDCADDIAQRAASGFINFNKAPEFGLYGGESGNGYALSCLERWIEAKALPADVLHALYMDKVSNAGITQTLEALSADVRETKADRAA